MSGQTCALPGCFKPPWPFVPQGDSPALACGNLHHQLLMASRFNRRFNPTLPHPPHQAILDRNAAGLCALLSCEEAPSVGHSWCSRTHYLLWLKEFTYSLQPEQICVLPGCTRHVFVDESAPPSRFCGWRHEQKFVMRGALQHRQPEESLPSAEVWSQQLPSSADESKRGHRLSLNSRLRSLTQFAHSRIAPANMRVIEDFYKKHPWEGVTERQDCWLIAHLEFTGKKRKLTTKDHYHWKQSGPRFKKSKLYTKKYYRYEKMKGKEKEADEQLAESTDTMQEYTMEDVEWYSLIHLGKEKPSIDGGKLGNEQPRKQCQYAEHIDIACSQDTITSKLSSWNDNTSIDSTFRGLEDLISVQIPVS